MPQPRVFPISNGIQLSLNNSTWYALTDHNRSEIQIQPELIEKTQRTASGAMKKYVVAQKQRISVSWSFIPSKTSVTVDGKYSAAWLEAFFTANAGIPIYVKVTKSKDTIPSINNVPNDTTFVSASTGNTVYSVFMTSFAVNVVKRSATEDYVNMSIEFTEV